MDWAALLRTGLHGLRLIPADFWALTPADLMLMLGADKGDAPMGRTRLDELAQTYPDRAKGVSDE